jgi:uncharacterized phage-like protein YoqJ
VEQFMNKVICGTGHRPPKLGGYNDRTWQQVLSLATLVLSKLKPTKVISGMALGWDQALAFAAITGNIPLTAAIPFAGQELRWPSHAQHKYHWILDGATRVVRLQNCAPENMAQTVLWMQQRNEQMVDHADVVLALWDGIEKGGTWNCVEYARRVEKPVVNCWAKFATLARETL